MEVPFVELAAFGARLEGQPDLVGTRLLLSSAAMALIAFAVFVGWLPWAGGNRLSPRDEFFVDVLVLVLLGLILVMLVAIVRRFIHAGAWFHIDRDGFAYGDGLPDPGMHATDARTYVAWSRVERQASASYDVSVDNVSRSDALNPSLRFWYRTKEGALAHYAMPLQLRGDAFRCLRFRNSHVLRVVLLQRLAGRGLRFHPDVFVEAGVDPETWARRRAWRYLPWVGAGVTAVAPFAIIDITWSTPRIIAWVLVTMTAGFALTAILGRRDPRLRRIITFTDSPER